MKTTIKQQKAWKAEIIGMMTTLTSDQPLDNYGDGTRLTWQLVTEYGWLDVNLYCLPYSRGYDLFSRFQDPSQLPKIGGWNCNTGKWNWLFPSDPAIEDCSECIRRDLEKIVVREELPDCIPRDGKAFDQWVDDMKIELDRRSHSGEAIIQSPVDYFAIGIKGYSFDYGKPVNSITVRSILDNRGNNRRMSLNTAYIASKQGYEVWLNSQKALKSTPSASTTPNAQAPAITSV